MVDWLLVQGLTDSRVGVALRREGETFWERRGEPKAFTSPLDQAALSDLRWYLEDYLQAPYAVYEKRGETVQGQLSSWGEALFSALFGSGAARDAYLKAREGIDTHLVIQSNAPSWLALPWELLKDPERDPPLALDLFGFSRSLPTPKKALIPTPAGEALRVLMVNARPAGLGDVGYPLIAQPLLERLEAVRGNVVLEVLRPPTAEALERALNCAREAGRAYHILHFDGLGAVGQGGTTSAGMVKGNAGEGRLLFESPSGELDAITAARFAGVVRRGQVPVVVLNVCQSGMLKAEAEAFIATRLLQEGVASVVAIGYRVYAVAVAEFMAVFYEALFQGQTVAQAVAAGRRRMARHAERPSPKGPMPLDDWVVPVHYLRRALYFPELVSRPPAPCLDTALDRLKQAPSPLAVPAGIEAHAEGSLDPVGRFVGRDAAFCTLELAARLQRVVLIHGLGGTGKTELAKAFARWLRDSGGLDRPNGVVFYSFRPGMVSFRLDGVVNALGLRLFGPDFIGQTETPAERRQLILEFLHQHRLLLIWDNFESVHAVPDPARATPPLYAQEREDIVAFVASLQQPDSASALLLTSRSEEPWLGDVGRLELGGLQPQEAAAYADDLLAPYPRARLKRQTKAFAELLAWLDGHPLSLRLLLPQLETAEAPALLAALRGYGPLPSGFETVTERSHSLTQSLRYSFDHLSAATRALLPALALFEGVADVDVLGVFSDQDGVPQRFAEHSRADWAEALDALVRAGLLAALGDGMYRLPPALPAYLSAEWQRLAGTAFEAERGAARHALLGAYAVLGGWLDQQINTGSAESAFAVIELEQCTLGLLLALALETGRYRAAQALLEPLNDFWEARGMTAEGNAWVERCRAVLEGADGVAPELDTDAGRLWLFTVEAQANRKLLAGELAAAETTYNTLRDTLEAAPRSERRDRHLASAYYNLGAFAHDRGELETAEGWYQKALTIDEALGSRPGLAQTYHQLGRVAHEAGELETAEGWYQKALTIDEALGSRPGLAQTYHRLGRVAHDRGELDTAEGWYQKALTIHEALGSRPGMAMTYHNLGAVAHDRGELETAEGWYQKSLAMKKALGNRPGLASSYYQLGRVAHDRGELDTAEGWYQKALTIDEALGNRLGMPSSCGQLGLLAEARGDTAAALGWMVRCVALFPKFPHPATGPGPQHLVRLTVMLGLPALEKTWQHTTGQPLPAMVREAVNAMNTQKGGHEAGQ